MCKFNKLWSLTILSLLIGCSNNIVALKDNAPMNRLMVWADDDSDIAMVQAYPANTPNAQQQIITRTLDGEQQKAITTPQQRDYQGLYYMKSAGYIIAESTAETTGWLRFERIDLNGNAITIIETPVAQQSLCQTQPETPKAYIRPRVIPSPDGKTLAYISSQECAIISVDFLSALDLVTLDSQIINTQHAATATWRSQGDLILAIDDGKTAWQLQVKQSPKITDYPKCTEPVTRSSAIAADGRLLANVDGKPARQTTDKARAFGCQ